jgi:hypothetical protein
MAEQKCANCTWRAKYDAKPKSFLGRLWRWHINFCPGWKSYFTALSPEEKSKVAGQYKFSKYHG